MTIYAKEAVAVWKSGTAFDVTMGSGATLVTDGDAQVGISPMELVLAALVGCTGADVIEILRKKHQDVSRLEIRVFGDRSEAHPRVYTESKLNFIVTGHTVDPEPLRPTIVL